MMQIQIYGIPNCDTVKKARKWLDAQGLDHAFNDYKKVGADADKLTVWIADKGVDAVLNKRGTTYRKLSEEQKSSINDSTAIDILRDHPSMIKRPILVHEGEIILGFKDSAYAEFFKLA